MREAIALGPLDWMTRQLVETEGARARLGYWLAAGRPEGPFEPNVFGWTDRLFDAAEEVWRRLPPPVAWHASAGTVIAGVDWPCAGLSGYAPRLSVAATFDQQLQMVCVSGHLSPRDLASVVAHEVAHGWTSVITTRARAANSRAYQEIRRTVAAGFDGTPDTEHAAALDRVARQEELAHLLAAQWGFDGMGADIGKLRRDGSRNYIREGARA